MREKISNNLSPADASVKPARLRVEACHSFSAAVDGLRKSSSDSVIDLAFRSSPVAMMLVDNNSFVVESNLASHEIFGGDIIGRNIHEIILECVDASWIGCGEYLLNNGRYYSINHKPIGDDWTIVTADDITSIIDNRISVSKSNSSAEIAEVSARLAHLVRTPLASAMIYASSIFNEGVSPEKRREFSDKLMSRLKYMESLIGDMLLLSRGVSGATEVFTIEKLISDFYLIVEPQITGRSMSVNIREVADAEVSGNESSIVSVLISIFENAAREVRDGLELSITTRKVGDYVEIVIADNGNGIDERILPNIFEPFFTMCGDGAGIGLSVARKIVDLQGGYIRAKNSVHGGAEFTVGLRVSANNII